MWILPKQLHTLASVQDTEALSLDLNESSQLCAQSLFVRSKPSPLRTWLQKWKRDSWTQHLYGRILKPSLGKAFETEWTSSLAVIPASHSPQQASEPVKTIPDTCGLGSQMELGLCAPESVSSRMLKDTSRWDSPASSAIWKKWVTKCRGEYSARLNAVRFTNANEYLSWPSPVASEVRQGFQDRSRGMKGSQESLTTVVIKHGPAAPVNPSTHGSRPESWATPTARDHKSGRGNAEREYSELTPMVERTQSGKLNSRWCETLMGVPVGWTMPSCASPVTIELTSCDY